MQAHQGVVVREAIIVPVECTAHMEPEVCGRRCQSAQRQIRGMVLDAHAPCMHAYSQVPSVLHQLIMRYGLQQVQQLRYIPHPQCEAEVRVGQHIVERLVHVVLKRGGAIRSEGSGLAGEWY